MKTVLLIAFTFVAMNFASAQKQPKTMEVSLQTTAQCGDCKERIEEKLNYTKGVIYSELDNRTKILTVKFKPAKISLEEVKTVVSNIGYDIDDMKANPEGQSKLPECCQPGGHDK
ncbi:MAG: heavy-metal-associated domain-containing protein [Crocinitomicaceae bacterium]|nr:heavy-metal-associated domain-containing protein [Crocinitomicaceae bacterium]